MRLPPRQSTAEADLMIPFQLVIFLVQDDLFSTILVLHYLCDCINFVSIIHIPCRLQQRLQVMKTDTFREYHCGKLLLNLFQF